MLIPPKYFLTPKISSLLSSIEASKEVINSIDLPQEIELNIRRASTLKSSLFSARIEGNDLTLDDLSKTPSKSQKKHEVFNILKALDWSYSKKAKDLRLQDILKLHQIVMHNLIDQENLGIFRTEVGAIFNSAGIAIYLPPTPKKILPLINKLLIYLNSTNKEPFIPIKAAISHYIFEKIHPFLDGNGRVGRIILQAILQKEGYGMKGLLPLEQYLDQHRLNYYQALEASEKDITEYIEFILEAIAHTARETKDLVLKREDLKTEDYLLPRRAEILNIIKEHRLVSFDMLKRRFMVINQRTLRYDLKKLQDSKLIKKRGTTKGVYYESISDKIK